MLIFKKEKEARKLVLQHISATNECVGEVRSMLEDYIAGDREASRQHGLRVKSLEQQADKMKREAREVLHQGAFLPQIRADVHHMVEMVDSIAGISEDVAKFLNNQSPRIPDEYEAGLLDIAGLCVTCFHELRKALKDYIKPKGEIGELHDHVQRVSQLESSIDEKQAALTRQVFDSAMPLAEKMHFCQLLRLVASISDQAEDVSDELESVVMRSVV